MRCLAGELQMSSGYHSAVTSSILKNSEGSPGGFCWGVREMTWPPAPLDVAACRRVRVAAWCLANQGVLNTEPACWLGKAQLCGAVWYISGRPSALWNYRTSWCSAFTFYRRIFDPPTDSVLTMVWSRTITHAPPPASQWHLYGE